MHEIEPDLVVHAYNLNTKKTEEGASHILCQVGLLKLYFQHNESIKLTNQINVGEFIDVLIRHLQA